MSEEFTVRITESTGDDSGPPYKDIKVATAIIKQSSFFRDQILTCSLSSASQVDTVVYFPPQFNHVFDLYLELNSAATNDDAGDDIIITSSKVELAILSSPLAVLADLLRLANFLDDKMLFQQLMITVRKNYALYQETIHNLPDDIQYDIYLELPYCLSPYKDLYFFEVWIKRNNKKDIVVDGVEYYSSLRKVSAWNVPITWSDEDGDTFVDNTYDHLTEFDSTKDGLKEGVYWQWSGCNSASGCQEQCHDNCHNYRSRQLVSECYYLRDMKHGVCRKWNKNGILLECAEMQNGMYHGVFREWDKSGVLLECAEMQNSMYHGLRVSYDNNSKAKMERWFENNQQHGVRRQWDSQGMLSCEKNYVKGLLEGVNRTWYVSGYLQFESEYLNNKRHGVSRQWYDGIPITSDNVVINSNVVDPQHLLTSGLMSQSHYNKDEEVGICDNWYPITSNRVPINNSQVSIKTDSEDYQLLLQHQCDMTRHGRLRSRSHYVKDRPHGDTYEYEYEWFDSDLTTSDINDASVVANVDTDETTTIKMAAVAIAKQPLKAQYMSRLDKVHGQYREWFEDGNLKYVRTYCKGKQHGLWQEWYSKDEITKAAAGANVESVMTPVMKLEYNFISFNDNSEKLGKTYKHGDFREWRASGQLIYHVRYDRNREVHRCGGKTPSCQ